MLALLVCSNVHAQTLECDADARNDTGDVRVRWKKGALVFHVPAHEEDEPPAYRYCAFDAAAGLHLIGHFDGDRFGGVLVEHATGRVLPAGHFVMLSPGRSRYFAAVQPWGMDGEEWYVYARTGKLVWKGVSGILTPAQPQAWIATFDNPRWSASGELQATVHCELPSPRAASTVTLRRDGGGYRWEPDACPRG